mgnify:CR=1 FL=1
MVLDDQDWQLPQLENIKVTAEELMLLDWILCSGSALIPGATVDDLIERWSSVRLDVWKCLSEIDRLKIGPLATVSFEMDEFTAKVLLALTPTTFRWGTGVDCGFSLKMKLFHFLSGEIENDNTQDETNSNSEDQSTGSAGSES